MKFGRYRIFRIFSDKKVNKIFAVTKIFVCKIFIRKKSQNSGDSNPAVSPIKESKLPNFCGGDDRAEINFLTPKKIDKNDPLLSQGFSLSDLQNETIPAQELHADEDEEWEESLRMSKKQIPEIKVPSLSPAKKRRQKLELQGPKAFNEGHYKISPSINVKMVNFVISCAKILKKKQIKTEK